MAKTESNMTDLSDGALDAVLLSEALSRVGATVRDLRLRHGLSQQTAASRAGLSQKGWSRVEAGEGSRLGDLLAIQYLFGVESLETFFGRQPSRQLLEGGVPMRAPGVRGRPSR